MARRPRRNTAEVRHLILEAARERLAADGFGGAATNAIANAANVSETVLLSSFPYQGKAFRGSSSRAVRRVCPRYTQVWRDVTVAAADPATVLRDYAAELYEIVARSGNCSPR